MKKLLFPLFLITFFSCDQVQSINSKGAKSNSKYYSLLLQYNNIGIDTLLVYSPEDSSDAWSGRALDSLNALFFPEDMAKRHFSEPPGLFASYKFAIDSNRLGLITRTPSDYVPSSMKMFIYDKRKDSLTSYIELGELFGDAGDVMIKKTWLFRDSSKHLLALINVTQKYYNSVDNPKDTTVNVSEHYSLLDLSKDNIDTVFADQEKLPAKFQSLLTKGR